MIVNVIKNIFKIAIKAALIVVGTLGIILSGSADSFMGNGFIFMYFTIQSNIFIILMSAIFLVNDIMVIAKKKQFVYQELLMVKFVATIAITITFLVFFGMLAPSLGASYLRSFNNLSLHAVVPILAIIDFFVFDKDIYLNYLNCLFALISPTCYFIFFLVGVAAEWSYSAQGNKSPYFFLDFNEIGWFGVSEKGPGVAIWCLILMAMIAGLSVFVAFLMRLRQGKIKKKKEE